MVHGRTQPNGSLCLLGEVGCSQRLNQLSELFFRYFAKLAGVLPEKKLGGAAHDMFSVNDCVTKKWGCNRVASCHKSGITCEYNELYGEGQTDKQTVPTPGDA